MNDDEIYSPSGSRKLKIWFCRVMMCDVPPKLRHGCRYVIHLKRELTYGVF